MQPYEFQADDAFRFARAVGAVTHRSGDELQFKYCPYCNGGPHHDKNTFSISLKTGAWNCKRGTCEKEGNMITLAQDFSEFSLGNAAVDDFYLKRERFKRFMRKPIESKDVAVQYLESRGIPEAITRQYEITIKKDTDNVMVFPFVDDKNDLWFIKYRNIKFDRKDSTGSKEWCEKERKPILFGMNHCNFENKTLVMTEGQIDSLSCAAAGIENAVSVPLGKNGFTWYPYCFNFLGRFDELIVFGDYEKGEISLLDGMKTRFHGRVKHVRPEDYLDCKDANEILTRHGPEAVKNCIQNAVDVPVEGLTKLKDIQSIRLSDLEHMTTGIVELDKKCTFYFGELIVLTGSAGEGKSTLASQWATMAVSQGYPTMIYSGEMASGTVKNWMDYQIVGPHNLNAQHDITDEVYKAAVASGIYDNVYVYNNDADSDQEHFLKTLVGGIQRYGIRFVVIDNLMTVMDYNGSMELNDAQTAYTKTLAKIAQDYNVIIVLIVHPRKSKQGLFTNDDIAGSSNITNRAHKVIRYSRPTQSFTDIDGEKWEKDELYDCPIRELTVLKDRFTGKTISKGILLYFDERTKRISETKEFNWRLSWDNDSFVPIENMDDVPFL